VVSRYCLQDVHGKDAIQYCRESFCDEGIALIGEAR
jgi:hypothetical protein